MEIQSEFVTNLNNGCNIENIKISNSECEMIDKDLGETFEQRENKCEDANRKKNEGTQKSKYVKVSNLDSEMTNKDFRGSFEQGENEGNKSEDTVRNQDDRNSDNNEETKGCESNNAVSRECNEHESESNVERNPPQTCRENVQKEISPEGEWVIRTYTGYIVTIKVHPDRDRPINFGSETAQLMWDKATEINLTRLKHQIQTGEYIPDDATVEVDPNPLKASDNKCTDLPDSLVSKEERRKKVVDLEKRKVQLLEDELKLVELILQIQDSFSGEHQVKAGLGLMNEILKLDITPLMLKKNPFVVNTIYCLCNFEDISEQSNINLSCGMNDVKVKAGEIYEKFQSLFIVPVNSTFEEYFSKSFKFMWKIFEYNPSRICELVTDHTNIF